MNKELILALVCTLCVIAFFVGTVLNLQHYFVLGKERPRQHVLCMVIAYGFSVLAYGTVTIRALNTDWAIFLRPFYIIFATYAIIFPYKFIMLVTQIGTPRRFGRWHYFVPLLLAAGFGVWSSQVPYEVRYDMLTMPGLVNWNEPLIYNVYKLLPLICVVYAVGYGIIVFPHIKNYRKMIVDYSANEEHTSIGWLYADYAMIMASALLPISRLSYYWGFDNLIFLYPIVVAVWVVLMVYNTIKGSYVLVPSLTPEAPVTEEEEGKSLPRGLRMIDREHFERYMEEKKPFLNPELCITDMVLDLCTNRTYLSNYINQEYGVNFKTLINGYRLRELERLRVQQADKKKKKGSMELVLEAGFGSYRSYLTSCKREYEKSKLPFNKE